MLRCQGNWQLLGGLQYRGAEPRSSHAIGKDARRLQKSYSILQPLKVSRRAASVACRAGYTPFPFDKDDYIKCMLTVLGFEYEGSEQGKNGQLVFHREEDLMFRPMGFDRKVLLTDVQNTEMELLTMLVGGDTFHCIVDELRSPQLRSRPLALDLLWAVLQRGQEISRRDWKLLHVAVVEMVGMTYNARLFFGDIETGEIVYDMDCRPSDACWLAIKAKCPIYCKKDVWDMYASKGRVGHREPELPTVQGVPEHINHITPSMPESMMRLRREMEVAVLEEDFTSAARIRDHPFMQLHKEAYDLRQAGKHEAAAAVLVNLLNMATSRTDDTEEAFRSAEEQEKERRNQSRKQS